MDEHELLVRHLVGWAEGKNRPVDPDLVSRALALRWRYDELEAGAWPPDSVERLLLTTWPAYGEELADPDALVESLDTLWRFLRATGRMRAQSASPTALRAEARRAARHMPEAFADPARHSTGRILMDFGRSLGISLDDTEDGDEIQRRLGQIQDAWNAQPIEERRRLMPDPSPKSVAGQAFSSIAQARLASDEDTADVADEEGFPLRGDPERAAQDARDSSFVRSCLQLAAWVGTRREVTTTGVLRPAVAREAYRELGLWGWERELDRLRYGKLNEALDEPEVDRLMADSALNAWTSAGDCLPLDRLWYAADTAGLVEVRSRTAHATGQVPESDDEWQQLALVLLMALCLRLGWYVVEPVVGAFVIAMDSEGPVPLAAVEEWWISRAPGEEYVGSSFLRDLWPARLRTVLFHFDDAGVWHRDDSSLELTDLGREFCLILVNAVDSGLLSEFETDL